MKIVDAQNEACYGWRWGCWDREERVEGSGGDARATVPLRERRRLTRYSTPPRRYSSAGTVHSARRLGLQGRWGRPAAGLRPRPAREKGFPSNLLLN